MIQVKNARPEEVQQTIDGLAHIASSLELIRAEIGMTAIAMSKIGASQDALSDLADAAHDADHTWRHVTAARRGLVMSWPRGDE